jgi:succinate-semialdehyde dehydrogenase/glutarate-semialdehyde dehydrogenase
VIAEMGPVTRLWAQLRVGDRARYLEKASQGVVDEFDDTCAAIAGEARQPTVEIASLEVIPAIDALRWLGEGAKRLLGAHRFALPRALHPLTRASAGHAPVGVVGVRGEDGAPFGLPLCAIGAALLGGNGVVFAPADGAAVGAERILRVLGRAGLPEGLVALGEPSLEGCDVVLDLGAGPSGGDAMIVLADARLDRAVEGALWAACAGAGERAGSLKRVFVERDVFEEFVSGLAGAASALEPGSGELGEMSSERTCAALQAAIDEALGLGALVRCGGRGGGGAVGFAPVVLTDVPAAARLRRERVGGPVVCVSAVADPVEAAALANSPQRCLGASIWSADRRHAVRIARELEARVVWGNDHVPALPLRQAAADALEDCGRAQLITWEPPSGRPPWRYPYDDAAGLAARAVAALHSRRDGEREQAVRDGGRAVVRVLGRAVWRP